MTQQSASNSGFDDEQWNGWAYIVREFVGAGRKHWPPFGRGHWLGPFGSPRSVLLGGFWATLALFVTILVTMLVRG